MNFQRAAAYAYGIMLTGYFGLFALLMSWNTFLAPSRHFPVALVLLVVVLPLLLPLRGVLHGRQKSCSWSAYISLLYLTHGIIECYVNPYERLYAGLEIFLSVLLFFGASYYVRFIGKAAQTEQ